MADKGETHLQYKSVHISISTRDKDRKVEVRVEWKHRIARSFSEPNQVGFEAKHDQTPDPKSKQVSGVV